MGHRLTTWGAQQVIAVRVLVLLIVLTGLIYPLAMTALSRLPGLRYGAQGSPLLAPGGTEVGSALIGQSFTDPRGRPLPRYFQPRPSHAGAGYDATDSGASNLGPQNVIDTPAGPSLLTQVCSRSKAVGDLEHVDGSRPYCTADGVGAVLGVYYSAGTSGEITKVVSLNQTCPATPFLTEYHAVRVDCVVPGEDHSGAVTVPVRGDAPAHPVVPPDAVTASGSGLDPQISPAYADLQIPRIARERQVGEDEVRRLVAEHTTARPLGILGEPAVNVLQLNLALDRTHPTHGS